MAGPLLVLAAAACGKLPADASNFIGQHEFQARDSKEQMAEPYKRIVFMHLVLIFGGGLSLVLGNSTPVLLAVIAVKIWVDVRAHIKEHAAMPNEA